MRCRLSPVTRLLACEARHKLPAACVVVAVLLLGGSFRVAAQPAHPEPGAAAAQPAAAHEGAGNEEHQGGGITDMIARLVNFAILAGTLVYLLRSPFRTYLADRSTQIRRDLVNAAELKQQAAAQMEEIERRMKALPGELDALRAARVFASNSSAAACARARDASASSRADRIAPSRSCITRVVGRSSSRSRITDSVSTKTITQTTDRSGINQRLFQTPDKTVIYTMILTRTPPFCERARPIADARTPAFSMTETRWSDQSGPAEISNPPDVCGS